MKDPSPRTHLKRLAVLLVAGFAGFLVLRTLATPESWNYADWYRGDSPIEIAQLPLIYGGNESCQGCHEFEHEELVAFDHKTLSCESCHGALADHVKQDAKFAAATIDDTAWQCLNCHAALINKPEDFPQFPGAVEDHKSLEEDAPCVACHNPHDPVP